MPRELITVQVGQCGNQIAHKFWDLALKEHSNYNKDGNYDEPMSAFFRNLDCSYEPPANLSVNSHIKNLKARSVVIDTEEGVLSQLSKSRIGEIFDPNQFVCDVSGAGNNWAQGYYEYGPKLRSKLEESLRVQLEHCDSPQSFLITHSLGGGTGSGFGTYALSEVLSDL
mmetsp:Transcript_19937/g.44045  ORF Transcript_19937/g.44045 Transcript_19937/m.44045 type:complete len:169 (+) Transcript_19937:2-508(+)